MDTEKYERIEIDVAEPLFGAQVGIQGLWVHKEGTCAGQYCSIHNPSDHPLKDARLNWRSDTGVMERICAHGVGHPDPDHMAYVTSISKDNKWQAVHSCDGCCRA
jgi:hypothetical protein